MLERLSLRIRVFLIFAGLAAGVLAVIGLGLWLGMRRLAETGVGFLGEAAPGALNAFVTAGTVAGFGTLGLVAGVWYLFDQNVARPIETLAGGLRTDSLPNEGEGRYLGDLAPAARARLRQEHPEWVAASQAGPLREREMLEQALTASNEALLMADAEGRVVMYNPAAAETLPGLVLNRPVEQVLAGRSPRRTTPLSGGGLMLALDHAPAEDSFRRSPDSLAYDFSGVGRPVPSDDRALSDLDCVIFDLETTGLSPAEDSIVQIGAIRVLRGRVIGAEYFDTLVNPGRPIPPASTKIHRITDQMVRSAPDVATALHRFAEFTHDAVLVAHNAPFDVGFLRKGPPGGGGPAFNNPVLDTVLLSAMVWGQSAPHSLDALTERLGITIPAALRHTAMGDARATAAAFVRLLPALEGKGLRTMADIRAEAKKHRRLQGDANTPA